MRPDDPRLPGIAKEIAQQDMTYIGQRTCNLSPSVFWQLLCKAGGRTVFEIDDDLFNIHPSNQVAWKFYGNSAIRENLMDNARAAFRVTCSTEPLADKLREFNPDVRVVPNSIPDWLLTHSPEKTDNGKVTIGWGGSPTHAVDFEECQGMLKQFLNRRDDVEFHCIGSNYIEWMKLPKDKCRFTPWVASVPDFFRTIDYDIGIAPLRPHIFNRSKSHIKVLECAALGIPVIASDVYPYSNFIEHGKTGLLVRREHEWGKYLRLLTEDPAQRAEMGANARKAAAQYSMSRLAPVWEEAITL